MAVLSTGQSFSSGNQVTAQKLNDIIGQATFTSAADTTDNSTLTVLGSGKLKVADTGITSTQLATDSVITAKIQDGAVTSAKLDASAVSVLMPSSTILPYAATVAPTGYLLCDGAAISRTTYSTLFGLVGTTYGVGDGSSTFNIPDLRGRVIAGQDDMGGSSADRLTTAKSGLNGDNLGATGGDEEHILATAEMEHTNTTTTTSHNVSAGSGVITAPFAATTGTIASSSATGHANVQPTIILNYIIKT